MFENVSSLQSSERTAPDCYAVQEQVQESVSAASDNVRDKDSFFSIIHDVAVKPVAHTSERSIHQLSGNMARLISAVSLGAALLGPLSGCATTSDVPCPTPTATNDSSSSKPISCTSSGGGHYLWYPSRGGWVPSDDGVNPRPGASGVGADDGHGGVGGDHGSSGEGGGGEGGHGGGGEGG